MDSQLPGNHDLQREGETLMQYLCWRVLGAGQAKGNMINSIRLAIVFAFRFEVKDGNINLLVTQVTIRILKLLRA